EDFACAIVPADGSSHDANRPCAGDKDILPNQVKHQRRMGRVAQRVKERNDLLVQVGADGNAVGCWYAKELGKGTVPIDPNAPCLMAPLAVARPAVSAVSADNMPFT